MEIICNGNKIKVEKKPDIVLRTIHDVFYLIDIHANYYNDECYLYEVNDIGVFIWNHIDDAKTVSDIALMLQKEIIEEIDISILLDDINEFIFVMYEAGFLIQSI